MSEKMKLATEIVDSLNQDDLRHFSKAYFGSLSMKDINEIHERRVKSKPKELIKFKLENYRSQAGTWVVDIARFERIAERQGFSCVARTTVTAEALNKVFHKAFNIGKGDSNDKRN